MVRRHPGVVGGQDFPENGDHKMTWEEIKKQEREEKKKAAEKL